jgi:hypothetical protein
MPNPFNYNNRGPFWAAGDELELRKEEVVDGIIEAVKPFLGRENNEDTRNELIEEVKKVGKQIDEDRLVHKSLDDLMNVVYGNGTTGSSVGSLGYHGTSYIPNAYEWGAAGKEYALGKTEYVGTIPERQDFQVEQYPDDPQVIKGSGNYNDYGYIPITNPHRKPAQELYDDRSYTPVSSTHGFPIDSPQLYIDASTSSWGSTGTIQIDTTMPWSTSSPMATDIRNGTSTGWTTSTLSYSDYIGAMDWTGERKFLVGEMVQTPKGRGKLCVIDEDVYCVELDPKEDVLYEFNVEELTKDA